MSIILPKKKGLHMNDAYNGVYNPLHKMVQELNTR
jgi:hypothetical protein